MTEQELYSAALDVQELIQERVNLDLREQHHLLLSLDGRQQILAKLEQVVRNDFALQLESLDEKIVKEGILQAFSYYIVSNP